MVLFWYMYSIPTGCNHNQLSHICFTYIYSTNSPLFKWFFLVLLRMSAAFNCIPDCDISKIRRVEFATNRRSWEFAVKGGRELNYQSRRSRSPPSFRAGAEVHPVPEVWAVRSACSPCAGALLLSQQPHWAGHCINTQQVPCFPSKHPIPNNLPWKKSKKQASSNRYYLQISSGNSTQHSSSFDLTNF